MLETIGLYAYAYLVGAVPTAYLIGRWAKGIDIRNYGSGNAGATNLAHHVGRGWVAPLLLRGVSVIGGALLAPTPRLLSAAIVFFLVGWALTRSSGVWVLLSLSLLPLWVLAFDNPMVFIWFCAGSVALMVLKRLLSNRQPLPVNLPNGQVLLNRLLGDRDVAHRPDWMGRTPGNLWCR